MEKKLSNERINDIRDVERANTIQEGISDKGMFSPKSTKVNARTVKLPPGVRSSTDMSENNNTNIQKELSTMKLSVISAI